MKLVPCLAVAMVRNWLGPWLLLPKFRRGRPACAPMSWGCCYVACEVVRELVGRRRLKPATVRVGNVVHWYLVDRKTGAVVDPTADQFAVPPDYSSGRGRGFLTLGLSKRAQALLAKVVEGSNR